MTTPNRSEILNTQDTDKPGSEGGTPGAVGVEAAVFEVDSIAIGAADTDKPGSEGGTAGV